MDALDHQRIGVEQHQAEIGLVPADNGCLQPLRRAVGRRVERGGELFPASLQLTVVESPQSLAIEAVVKVRAVPAFAGR